jgi:predicted RNA-binding protein with EMAP domain
MMNLNETKLEQVVDAAIKAVGGNKRWTNAIIRAEEILTSGNPYIHFTGHSLLMLSESGEIYEANGVCQCRAFEQGQPCKHRAAYKLMVRYQETAH